MRLEVTIPDQLFSEAQRLADAGGISVDRFVIDAMQLHLADDLDDDGGPQMTPELIASLRRGEADLRAGKGKTMEQVEESLAKKKAEWLQANRP